MRGLPPELIYFLFFVALFLFQFLKKMAARQADKEAPPEVALPPRVAYPGSFDEADFEPAAPVAWAAPPISASDFGRKPPAPVVVRPSRPRRFSRQALFGTSQDVQKAVVIATILGPCRALEPRGDEGVPPRVRKGAGG